jgi:hypothetical protein
VLEAGAQRLLHEETLERADLDALRTQWFAGATEPGQAAAAAQPPEPTAPASGYVRAAG